MGVSTLNGRRALLQYKWSVCLIYVNLKSAVMLVFGLVCLI